MIEMIKFWSKLGGNDWIDSGGNLVGSVNILKDLFQASIVLIMFDILLLRFKFIWGFFVGLVWGWGLSKSFSRNNETCI